MEYSKNFEILVSMKGTFWWPSLILSAILNGRSMAVFGWVKVAIHIILIMCTIKDDNMLKLKIDPNWMVWFCCKCPFWTEESFMAAIFVICGMVSIQDGYQRSPAPKLELWVFLNFCVVYNYHTSSTFTQEGSTFTKVLHTFSHFVKLLRYLTFNKTL